MLSRSNDDRQYMHNRIDSRVPSRSFICFHLLLAFLEILARQDTRILESNLFVHKFGSSFYFIDPRLIINL